MKNSNNPMKIQTTFCFALLLIFTPCLHALELNEKLRNWTREDGNTARAKLVDIVEDKISLEIKGKQHVFQISDFIKKDRDYIQGILENLPSGKVEKYTPQFHKDENRAFYKKHSMQSLVWRGEDGEELPMLVYQPFSRDLEKLPVIVYLHGTGGMGTDNTKPFFHCGSGAAKNLLAESFQKKSPCIVITPQIQKHSGWYSASFTDPSDEQFWLKNAIQCMAQEAKYAVDLDRVYIMGHSMGGHGVYEALAKLPNFYAAGVAISAVDDGQSLNKDNVDSRLWVFLNKDDKAESVDVAEAFTSKYRKLGGKVRTTVYESGGHNAWDEALKDQKFRSYLFKQRRK
ncbi:MAG: putative peptidase [Rubritalea sp.]|jgi:predicted peptidase